jgi:hypothetical protein
MNNENNNISKIKERIDTLENAKINKQTSKK